MCFIKLAPFLLTVSAMASCAFTEPSCSRWASPRGTTSSFNNTAMELMAMPHPVYNPRGSEIWCNLPSVSQSPGQSWNWTPDSKSNHHATYTASEDGRLRINETYGPSWCKIRRVSIRTYRKHRELYSVKFCITQYSVVAYTGKILKKSRCILIRV